MLGDRRHLPACLTPASIYPSHWRRDGHATLARCRSSSVAYLLPCQCDTLSLVLQGLGSNCRLSPNDIIARGGRS
jgi:hypothetical protein